MLSDCKGQVVLNLPHFGLKSAIRGDVWFLGGIAGEGDKSLYCFIRHPSLHGIGLWAVQEKTSLPKTERLVMCFVVLLFPCENSAFGKRNVFADRVFFGNGV